MSPSRIAILTAGGLAPCLSAVVGGLIEGYSQQAPQTEIWCCRFGYRGLLRGDFIPVTPAMRERAPALRRFGGSPIGTSRVRLTNAADCVRRGLVPAGRDPREVAADELRRARIDVLYVVGGDDTNLAAADLAAYLRASGYPLTVVGLPKTIDNDIEPVVQSLGAATAAEQGARFFRNVVSETAASARMLIVHEVMGRDSGWLTAATARAYLSGLAAEDFAPEFGLTTERWGVHGVYLPEIEIILADEAERLAGFMAREGNVNLFVSEGACQETVLAELQSRGVALERDAFGHVKLDALNVGRWFADRLGALIGAERVLVQKSGYFARSAPANSEDLALIDRCVEHAVACGLRGESGLVAEDAAHDGGLRAIDFGRVRGGKPLDPQEPWVAQLLQRVGQGGRRVDGAAEIARL